jgi:hypothetical protein
MEQEELQVLAIAGKNKKLAEATEKASEQIGTYIKSLK